MTIATINLEAFGTEPKVRDYGLLSSAAARPQSGAYGVEAYPTLFEKAAALLHSLASNHAFIDGNKRTAWWSAATFLTINDWALIEPLDEDAAEALTLEAAQSLIDVDEIAERLAAFFHYVPMV
jgi:death-on-curing protein